MQPACIIGSSTSVCMQTGLHVSHSQKTFWLENIVKNCNVAATGPHVKQITACDSKLNIWTKVHIVPDVKSSEELLSISNIFIFTHTLHPISMKK